VLKCVKHALKVQLKLNRRVVLFKRNSIGKLKYLLTPKTIISQFQRFSARFTVYGLPALLGDALHIRRQILLYKKPSNYSKTLPDVIERARIFDATKLAPLLNCKTDDIVRSFYRQHEFFVFRQNGILICAAEVFYKGDSAAIMNYHAHRKLCRSECIYEMLCILCRVLGEGGYKNISMYLYSGERKLYHAAIKAGFSVTWYSPFQAPS
jgi:hypothetical protein